MNRFARLAIAPFLLLGTLVAGCGDDPVDPAEVSIEDFVGTWAWNVININSSCGSENVWEAQVVIAQVGSSATEVTASSDWHADAPGPYIFEGTVAGNTLTIGDVTYLEDSGTLTATHQVTLQQNGNLSGTETWSWTGPGGTCTNGTADIVALRIN